MKKKRIEGRNTVEEVFHQCNQRGYRCYWRNCKENNILTYIVIVHPVSILMMRSWQFVLIIDTTYKTNKYTMLLLEAVGMTSTGKTFIMATAFIQNKKAKTYEWVGDHKSGREQTYTVEGMDLNKTRRFRHDFSPD
ncbi:hypothetical protein M9H77_14162 [Catharanthus roseus]|uniref:Uncharacterized protein n=1 Tax=Catharanthus roseus TaxID=4058 RepID=A0ACC0BMH7_CATRO|nr:hypothetical protein M9H77_14162 [Catharanthus roseus]